MAVCHSSGGYQLWVDGISVYCTLLVWAIFVFSNCFTALTYNHQSVVLFPALPPVLFPTLLLSLGRDRLRCSAIASMSQPPLTLDISVFV